MTVYEAVKQISCNDAAERLGLKGKRTGSGKGVWCCPFHDDKNPSMTCYDRDNRFYCFTCHASGDAANLYARVMGLPPKEAARKALSEFGLDDPADAPGWSGRRDAFLIRRHMVDRAVKAIRSAYQEGIVLLLRAQADGMVSAMEKAPDPEGWLWNHALERACRVQEASAKWEDMNDEDMELYIRAMVAHKQEPAWGEELPTPSRVLFRRILDDLARTDEAFPRLNHSEMTAVLDELMAA